MKQFSAMSKPEKRDFLSNDFNERMIRIEQRISASFNKPLEYNKTSIFKSMTPEQKMKYENYLKHKKVKKILAVLFMAIPVILLAVLNINFTGNFVLENIDDKNIYLFSEIVFGVLAFFIFLFLVIFLRKKLKDRWFNKKASSLDEIVHKKHLIKKHKVFK